MISFGKVKKYCKDDISLIENYDKAVADDNIWDCHHRREMTTSKKELLELGEYFNRPANELIFLTHSEHTILHNKCEHHSEETKLKISEANKGKTTWMKGKHHSDESKQKISAVMKGNKNRLGRPHSDETKKKLSIAIKGLHWFNNGIKNVFARECPAGFVKGILKRKKYEK